MFPTCSNRLLAGRNALSATDLTIVSSGCPTVPTASAQRVFDGLAVRHPQPSARGRAGRRTAARRNRHRAVVCSRALGEETAISDRPPQVMHREARFAASRQARSPPSRSASAPAATTSRARTRTSPSGDFPVAVNAGQVRHPTSGSAQTSDLQLEIENIGDEPIPDLAVTIYTGDESRPSGSFSVRSDQPGLADPNRPVWILENGFPKLAEPGEDVAELDAAASAGAEAAQTDTFSFGPLDAGRQTKRHRLARDPGPGRRHLHGPLRARRRPRRQGEGGHRRRRARSRASSWSRSPTSRREASVADNGNVVIENSDAASAPAWRVRCGGRRCGFGR